MSGARIRHDSVEYRGTKVSVVDWESGEIIDPTNLAVAVALLATDDDGEPTFYDAEWQPSSGPADVYRARVLVGSGNFVLTKGKAYQWLTKVTDTPEAPVKMAGILVVD